MPFFLPFDPEDANQTHRIQLDDSAYDINYRWSSTEKCWYCSIGAISAAPQTKFKLLCGYDLLRTSKAYDNTPNGSLYLIDRDEIYGRPTRNNVGLDRRFRLLYINEGEFE